MTEPAIHACDLGFGYRTGTWVFRGLTAVIEPGSVTAILGPNGRGKTTLLKVLLGILDAREGTLRRSGDAAYVAQTFDPGFNYSVLDVVLMGRARHIGLFAQPSARDHRKALEALADYGLDASAHRPFLELSGGQRQLVVFARAIASEAKIMILDEPMSALDFANQKLVLDSIRRMTRDRGLTALFTTHQPNHALAIADKTLLLVGEDKIMHGLSSEILSEPTLLRLYGTPMRRMRVEVDGRTIEVAIPIQ